MPCARVIATHRSACRLVSEDPGIGQGGKAKGSAPPPTPPTKWVLWEKPNLPQLRADHTRHHLLSGFLP